MDFNPFTVATVAILSGVIISVAKMFFDSMKRGAPSSSQMAKLEERLGRMEQAIDAIAVETERISEAQRFTSRLLAERSGIGDGSSAAPSSFGNVGQPRR